MMRTAEPARRRPWWTQLYVQVLVAIVAGALVGHYWPQTGVALKPLGDTFIKIVKMIIAPVIFLTIATGIGRMRSLGTVGSVAAKAFTYFIVVSSFALVWGLVVANVVRPGAGMAVDPATLNAGAVSGYAAKSHELTLTGFLLDIVPETFVGAFTGGNILQVLFVAIPFGISLALIGARAAPVMTLLDALTDAFFTLVSIFMRAAPIGAFGAFAFTIGQYGIRSVVNLIALVATFYTTSLAFVLIVLGGIALAAGFSILRLIAYLKEELLLVFGTSSSEAALPSLMEKMERAGVDDSVVGIVVPTGYSFNLDGTNIYMSLASLFIAQALGIELSLGEQLLLLGVAVISSKGAAGVTGAGFITLAATLSVVPSVPVAGMALILGVDRFMSECRALTNFIGNAVATIVVAKWQRALNTERLAAALSGTPVAPVEHALPAAGPGSAEIVRFD
ncbi:C4-dicarboxylate transporter DctA [Sphingomonas sp.]|jgi:aerobic C4-dicarboxylate transport protein|uniref:C4-dicarboxylate transporter DctA n=1 Tax=Sphingomonas sp. TaxID=28214 RepID=UPI0039C9506B